MKIHIHVNMYIWKYYYSVFLSSIRDFIRSSIFFSCLLITSPIINKIIQPSNLVFKKD